MERAGLLSGTRGEQIAGRFGIDPHRPVRPRPAVDRADRRPGGQPAAAPPPAGTLTGLDRYLHQRSHGMIGSLLWLIRSAAISAVLDGTEKITRKSLDAVEADITSQSPRPPAT